MNVLTLILLVLMESVACRGTPRGSKSPPDARVTVLAVGVRCSHVRYVEGEVRIVIVNVLSMKGRCAVMAGGELYSCMRFMEG